MGEPLFFEVPYSDVLPEPVQWFWEAVEDGEIPFVYAEDGGPRLDCHPVEDEDLKWVLAEDLEDRALYLIAVIAVDRGR